MAKVCLLGFLAWALPLQLAGTCLRCWPDAVVYFGYDAYLLLAPDSVATERLGKLFLGRAKDLAPYGRGFLEREHMEREGGNLFLRLEQIIKKSGKDHERLMKEAELEKQNFIKQLEEASKSFLNEFCSLSCGLSRYRPYEVAQCSNCQLLKVSCYDPMICAGPNVLAGVLTTLVILLVIGAVVWYHRRKKKAGGKDESNEDDKSSSSTSESSEFSDVSDEAAPNISKPLYGNVPNPTYVNVPNPTYVNVPSPPAFDIPSPPAFDIPSPPAFDIPSPPRGQ